ncbi:hypothetical protein CPC08DRAFT_710314 [Agrocybe pediades]|nr:hypothetical protein CPC08DRAFT_710314 [Agrocybe pediades]
MRVDSLDDVLDRERVNQPLRLFRLTSIFGRLPAESALALLFFLSCMALSFGIILLMLAVSLIGSMKVLSS